jgi:FkbM family methyltransferase
MELGITKQVWFEPNPEMFKELVKNIQDNPEALAFQNCVGDENKDVVLHISNNAGQSSSILELGTHKEAHPEVKFIKDISVKMVTIESVFSGTNPEKTVFANKPLMFVGDIDFLNIDIQGAELKALKGMGDVLHQFKWAYLEVNKAPLYIGCALVDEIDEYLSTFGFSRVETKWAGNTGWGDALYIKTK